MVEDSPNEPSSSESVESEVAYAISEFLDVWDGAPIQLPSRCAPEEPLAAAEFWSAIGVLEALIGEVLVLDRERPSPASLGEASAGVYPDIEGYRITGVLGKGGMGVVYRAVQTSLNRAVAVKVLPLVGGSSTPSSITRFRREATSAARLHHTNIVPVYDFGSYSGGWYYAMELIPGKSLTEVIRQLATRGASNLSPARLAVILQEIVSGSATSLDGPDEPSAPDPSSDASGASVTGGARAYFRQVARWMTDVADGLHYAHTHDIIHRDIKPSNLLLSGDGRLMIADFGLAKSTQQARSTRVGDFLGTLRYASPEQVMEQRVHVDHRTDVYSLGATMYELLCLQPAFPGDDDKKVLSAIITRDPIPPRKVCSSVPADLETICLACMQKDPELRYDTARALADDLRLYGRDLPIRKKRPGPAARALKFVRRRKAPVAAVLSCMLLVISATWLWHANVKRVEEKVNLLVTEGNQLLDAGKHDEAQGKFRQALELRPECVRALGNLARVLKEKYNALETPAPELLEEANELCDRAVRVDDENPAVWNVKGVVLKKLKRFDEAIDAYNQAIRLEPGTYAALGNRGVIHALAGNVRDAVSDLTDAAALVGTERPGCEELWYNLAAVELHAGDEAALEHVDVADTCNRARPAIALLRARIHLESDMHIDTAAALDAAKVADHLAGEKHPLVKRTLALAYLRGGELKSAIRAATRAIELEDASPVAYLVLAVAEAKLGGCETAAAHLSLADLKWPDDLEVRTAHTVEAPEGLLWYESASELYRLRSEAEALIQKCRPSFPEG